jgi:hypothetical protein
MTERIPKPESPPAPDPEPPRTRGLIRWLALGLALTALFTGVVLGMLHSLPRPHTQADYVMAGGLATMVTMLALFGALVSTRFREQTPFYKRRPKP